MTPEDFAASMDISVEDAKHLYWLGDPVVNLLNKMNERIKHLENRLSQPEMVHVSIAERFCEEARNRLTDNSAGAKWEAFSCITLNAERFASFLDGTNLIDICRYKDGSYIKVVRRYDKDGYSLQFGTIDRDDVIAYGRLDWYE